MSAGAPADSAARPRSVAVRVPATSANLGPGFDAFGLALGISNPLLGRIEGRPYAATVAALLVGWRRQRFQNFLKRFC